MHTIYVLNRMNNITDEFIVDKLNNSALASTNSVYVRCKREEYIKLYNYNNGKEKTAIFKVLEDNSIATDEIISLNTLQRTYMNTPFGMKIKGVYIENDDKNYNDNDNDNGNKIIKEIDSATFIAKNLSPKVNANIEITDDVVDDILFELNGVVVANDLALSYKNKIGLYPIEIKEVEMEFGCWVIGSNTKIKIISTDKSINIDCSSNAELFNGNFNFLEMGIGGLDKQFEVIFRRAFSSRLIPEKVLKNLGVNHVRGIILHGVAGCGKTLIARQIGKILNCEEPKIVSGPSLLSSYQGQSEKNVRDLFDDAFNDKNGKKLHLIILDEFDALSRKRGTVHDSGLSDKLVNQFLSMIDGPESLNNILLIAMTNRIELIDEALLRPGRFEIQIEIGLPDAKGRLDILNIHTNKMAKAGYLNGVNLHEIAEITNNFTGAELESVVKNAVSYCISKEIDPANISAIKDIKPSITHGDMVKSVNEIKPQFGTISKEIEIIKAREFELYSDNYKETYYDILDKIKKMKGGNVMTFLLCGDAYVGKTTMASNIAINCGLNCIKYVSSDKLLNYATKEQQLYDIFEQGYKTDSFILMLDSIERIIEYSKLGNIYNNKILQVVYTLLNKIIDNNKKVAIIMTSSNNNLMEQLEFFSMSNYYYILEDYLMPDYGVNVSDYFKNKKFIM